MKPTFLTRFRGLLVMAAIAGTGHAEPPVMRDAPTHEQLAAALLKAQQKDPMKNLPAVKTEDASVAPRPPSLLGQSDIISFGGLATLVPKRAILQIPKSCTDRIKVEPGARLVSWSEFYTANRGWITTIEVSREQAEGSQALAEKTQKLMSTCRNLIVATYLGGPISLLPAKVPVPPSTPSPSQPTPP